MCHTLLHNTIQSLFGVIRGQTVCSTVSACLDSCEAILRHAAEPVETAVAKPRPASPTITASLERAMKYGHSSGHGVSRRTAAGRGLRGLRHHPQVLNHFPQLQSRHTSAGRGMSQPSRASSYSGVKSFTRRVTAYRSRSRSRGPQPRCNQWQIAPCYDSQIRV